MIETLAPEARRQFTRMETVPVPPAAGPGECGHTGYARTLAQLLTRALDGTRWRAEARAPYWPHPENETHGQTVTIVDARWMITTTHRVPAHTSRDLFTITMNGHPIPYYVRAGELPHSPEVIAANVARHRIGYVMDDCDALMCRNIPTVGTYRAALCPEHAQQYADTGRW